MHSGKLIRSMPPNPGAVTAVYTMDNDDFLITVGGNKITFYSFRNEELYVHPYSHNQRRKRSLKRASQSQRSPSTTLPPITCFDMSRDSQLVAIASGRSVHIMKINNPEYQTTYEGHSAPVTCVHFAPNCEFLATGGEDRIVNIWSTSLGAISNTVKHHNAPITCVVVLMDSRRVISSDRDSTLHVWMADAGNLLQTIQGPYKFLNATNNMKFAISSDGDNTLKIWSLTREDEKYSVSHSDEITCFTITADSLYVITGSRDMSLKVWQATGGKLAQVLVGHTDAVTCAAVSVTNKTQVLSGSKDTNLIIWDLHTGDEIHTLAGHLGPVIGVKVSADGSTAVSGSDDKTLIVWETKRGLALTSLQMHVPFTDFEISIDCSRVLVQLVDSFNLPVICLHNTPAVHIKLPTYSAPARDVEDLRPQGPKRQMKRLLKKEVSLDTYTWQKKYGHLTSPLMMAQVDERLKRRFSVSASMEEISKIAEMKTITSQTNLGPEQAALAQSQHFDQLEALWNKRSPPRRRHNKGLSRQTSLVEDRLESSDDDEYHDERTGMLSASYDQIHRLVRCTGMSKLHQRSLSMHVWSSHSLKSPRSVFFINNYFYQFNCNSQHDFHSDVFKFFCPTPIDQQKVYTQTPLRSKHPKPFVKYRHTLNLPITDTSNFKAYEFQPNYKCHHFSYKHDHHRHHHSPQRDQKLTLSHQPDLVRDLVSSARVSPLPDSEKLTPTSSHKIKDFFKWTSIKNKLSTNPRNDDRVTPMKPRPNPIIIVENYEQHCVQKIYTNTVLHPRKARASISQSEMESPRSPTDEVQLREKSPSARRRKLFSFTSTSQETTSRSSQTQSFNLSKYFHQSFKFFKRSQSQNDAEDLKAKTRKKKQNRNISRRILCRHFENSEEVTSQATEAAKDSSRETKKTSETDQTRESTEASKSSACVIQ